MRSTFKARQLAGFAVLGLAGLAAASCSENSGRTETPTRSTDQGTGVLTLEARDRSFVPEQLAARLGEPIVIQLVNNGALKHSVSVYEDAAFDEPVKGGEL